MNAADAALLAQDLLAAVERAAAATTDPAEMAELAAQHDLGTEVLERAEREIAVRRRVQTTLAAEALLREPMCLRRFLSAGQKSLLIRHFGGSARYQALVPW